MTPPQRETVLEANWQKWVTDYAALRGWLWLHQRPARTARGWRTATSGTLGGGKGFPDLLLVRPADGRWLVAELKTDTGRLTAEQKAVHEALRACGWRVEVLRPRDRARVIELLR